MDIMRFEDRAALRQSLLFLRARRRHNPVSVDEKAEAEIFRMVTEDLDKVIRRQRYVLPYGYQK